MNNNTDVQGNSVLISISKHKMGNTRKLDILTFLEGEDIDPRVVKASKTLLESETVDKISNKHARLTVWLEKRTIIPFFRHGVYVLPSALLKEVLDEIEKVNRAVDILVEVLMYEYEELKESMKLRLGKHYNESDYIPRESIPSKFGIECAVVQVNAAEQLKEIDPDLYQEESRKLTEKWEEANGQIMKALASGFQHVLKGITDKLGKSRIGQRTQYRDDMLVPITEFFALFPKRNLIGSLELDAMVKQAQAVLSGVGPAELRIDSGLSEKVDDTFREISKSLTDMIKVVSTDERAFDFC